MPRNDYGVQHNVPSSHRQTKNKRVCTYIKENDDRSILGQKQNEVIKGSWERIKAKKKKKR
jgi:hypothetical protein